MGLERVELDVTDTVEVARAADGTSITVRRMEGEVARQGVNEVAFHEACHALATLLVGVKLYSASDVPGPGYLGVTRVGAYDRRIAAAAEAMGCDGTSHDMWTVRMMGDNPVRAVAEAYAMLISRKDELLAIATEIENAGTASGHDMADAKDRVHQDNVEITTRSKDGTTRTLFRRAQEGVVHVPIEV